MVVLREFLYRRDDLVAQFLEQLEGGGFDEERIKEQDKRASGIGGSAGARGIALSGERRKEGSSETELTMRQTTASRFNRLHTLLQEGEELQPLESLDDAIWEQLTRNEIIEVEAVLKLLPGVLEMNQATSVGKLLPLIEAMKSFPEDSLPESFQLDEADKVSHQIPVVQEFAQHFTEGPVPCTFVPIGALRYTFFAELARGSIIEELAALEGEVTVLAKITRKIDKRKPETMGQPVPGIPLNRAQRRKAGAAAPLTVRLQYPAAVVTAIGIYR